MSESIVQVHLPYPMLLERLEEVIEARINPEVFLNGTNLDGLDMEQFERTAERIVKAGLRTTIHGPYMDMSPGGTDELVRGVTTSRYKRLFEVVGPLKPAAVVLHAGYEARKFDGDVDEWLAQSLKTWPGLIKDAERIDTVIALENVFEDEPGPMVRLLEEIDSPRLQVCLDAGHINTFAVAGQKEWVQALGHKVAEVHLHDNNGERDEHLPPGEGGVDFTRFFELLKEYTDPDPIYTIEPHSEEAMWKGLKAIRAYI